MTTTTTTILACVSLGLLAVAPTVARADDAAASAPAAPSPHAGIGGHVGVAIPFVFLNSDKTQTIGDQFTLAFPIGIGFQLTDKAAIDFETIVGNPISPRGGTGLSIPASSTTPVRSCWVAALASMSARRPTSSSFR